tara:strand:- start:225 stop:398 length:174 start_codon:yes stop_codon:yes gene_type:complete
MKDESGYNFDKLCERLFPIFDNAIDTELEYIVQSKNVSKDAAVNALKAWILKRNKEN